MHDKNSETNLIRSVKAGKLTLVRTCLNLGTDINEVNYKGKSALHYAYQINKPEIIDLLIQHGADSKLADKKGRIPEDCAPIQTLCPTAHNPLALANFLKSFDIDCQKASLTSHVRKLEQGMGPRSQPMSEYPNELVHSVNSAFTRIQR